MQIAPISKSSPQHRHVDDGSIPTKFHAGDDEGIARDVRLYLRHVGDMGNLLRLEEATKAGARHRMNYRPATVLLGKRRWHVVHRYGAKCISVVEVQGAELGAADASGVLQQRIERSASGRPASWR